MQKAATRKLYDCDIVPFETTYTPFTRGTVHEANVFKIHVHDVCSKFASCLLHRVNGVLVPLRPRPYRMILV